MGFVVELGLMLIALTARDVIGAPACAATTVDDCIAQSQIQQLQQSDPTVYCVEGPRRVKQIFDCLVACGLASSANSNLVSTISNVDSYCAGQNSQCSSIVEKYDNFSLCYDGGLNSVIDGVVRSFNDDDTTALYGFCQKLAWGRSCQKQLAGKCSYLQTLQSADIASNYMTVAAFYVCGAESGQFAFNDTSACSSSGDMAAAVTDQCPVTCTITSATTSAQLCQALQTQADCIWTTTAGCSAIQSQFIVPRLASYWAANQLLGCNITVSGIVVWARAQQCSVDSLMSSCFNLSASSCASLDAVKQLLTMQFPLSQICSLLQTPGVDETVLLQQCIGAMRACAVPLGQVYNSPAIDAPSSVYETTPYGPLLGPFAVNAWGLGTLLDNLQLFTCQASGHVQCATTPTVPPTAPSTRHLTPAVTATSTKTTLRPQTPTAASNTRRGTPPPVPATARPTPTMANGSK